MENVMSAGYVVARENFKEASSHVSAEADPVMFNLLYGLQSLTDQIEADFALLWSTLNNRNSPAPLKKAESRKSPPKKKPKTGARKVAGKKRNTLRGK
jgi:hypothetical protein